MSFAQKLRELRRARGLTQKEVAEAIGVSRRAYIDYEQAGRYPRGRDVYTRMADLLGCNVEYLMDDNAFFIDKTLDPNLSHARQEADSLVHQIAGMFAGGNLTEEDKDAVMYALTRAYWDCKTDARPVDPFTRLSEKH